MRPTEDTAIDSIDATNFDTFITDARLTLRRALVARYGPEVGTEVAADAIAYAWQHWDRLQTMPNATGYLYRVAQSAAKRQHRWQRAITLPAERPQRDVAGDSDVDPLTSAALPAALARLKPDERVAVVLVHGYSWSYQEVADLLDVPVSTIRNHVHRGLVRLRTTLET